MYVTIRGVLRAVLTALAVLIAAILVLKIAVMWLEPRMAFFPRRGIQETPAAAGVAYRDVTIRTEDDETLHGWWLGQAQPRAQVIFWHGNGGNLSLWQDVVVAIHRRGFDVLAVDYRGYGASSGSPTEHGVYRDAAAAVREFGRRFQKADVPVIYWGRSLGSPIAASTIAVARPDALILESPMPDARSVLRGNPVLWGLALLSSMRFSTSDFLATYNGPLLIVHGDADSIVPFELGREVFDRAPTNGKRFLALPGVDHNDPYHLDSAPYWRAIDEFLAVLTRKGG